MAIKIGEEPCAKSSSGRGCVYKPVGNPAVGNGMVKHIWSCRRCGDKTYETLKVGDVDCPLSYNGIHQWRKTETVSFIQHYNYRDITENQACECCGSQRLYEYKSMIGYDPHRKR